LRNLIRWAFIIVFGLLTGCGGEPLPSAVSSTNPPLTPTNPTISTATVEVVPELSQTETLTIWIPETLMPVDNQTIFNWFEEQALEFEAQQENVDVQLRRKSAQDVGGILSTIRSASAVAPGAMPDLTLMRHQDLLVAAQNDLIQQLEGWVSSSVISSINDSALRLGFFNGQLYGLAYLLDVLLVTHHPEINAPSEWTFDQILRSRLSFAFPVGNTNGVNQVFLLQYLSAGGELPSNGVMTLDEDALLTTLQFYERAVEANLIDSEIVNYTSYTDYLPRIVDGSLDAGVVNVVSLNNLRNEDYQPRAAPIPVHNETPLTFLSGWMWVMVSGDTLQQTLAADFLSWMMDSDRQGEYAQQIEMIASQIEARRQFPLESLPNPLVDTLLANALIAPNDSTSIASMRAMQNALIAVLNGDLTAEEATRQAVEQVSG
jgi:maltose-binding protein MalE